MVLYVLKCYDSVNLCQVKTWRLLLQVHYYMFIAFSCLGKSVPIYFSNKNAKKNIFCLLEIELPYGQVQISQIVFCEIQIPSGKVQISQVVFSCTPAKKSVYLVAFFSYYFCIFNSGTWRLLWLVRAFQPYILAFCHWKTWMNFKDGILDLYDAIFKKKYIYIIIYIYNRQSFPVCSIAVCWVP